jgi:hypothetical protein
MLAAAIGYLASLLLGVSLLVSNTLKFRWWNTSGCVTFIIYGIMIDAYPIILANSVLFFINVYQLIKLYSSKENFELMEVNKECALAQKFINFYQHDIKKFFPEADTNFQQNTFAFVVLRNMAVANLFLANIKSNGEAEIEIDYTIPQYRDYKSGQFIFEKNKQHLIEMGINTLTYKKQTHQIHQQFLLKMGFLQEGNSHNFKKDLAY